MFRRIVNKFVMRFLKADSEYHEKMRTWLAIGYAVVGWHTMLIVLYYTIGEKMPKDANERREMFAKLSQERDARVCRIKGFKLVDEFLPDSNDTSSSMETADETTLEKKSVVEIQESSYMKPISPNNSNVA